MNDRVYYLLCSAISAIVVIIFQLVIGRRINKDVEELKTRLNYYTQSKIHLKTEERNALIGCFEKYIFWQSVLLHTKTGGLNESELVTVKNELAKIADAYFNFCVALSKAAIFIDNEELLKNFHTIKGKTLQLEKVAILFQINHEAEISFLMNHKDHLSPFEYIPVMKEANTKSILDSRKFHDEKVSIYSEISLIERELNSLIYKHLQNLINS